MREVEAWIMQGTQPGTQLPAAPGTAQQVAAAARPSPSAPDAIRREQTSVPAPCPAQPGAARASAPGNVEPGSAVVRNSHVRDPELLLLAESSALG